MHDHDELLKHTIGIYYDNKFKKARHLIRLNAGNSEHYDDI